MSNARLSYSRNDIVSSQQPSIIGGVAYLTPGDAIKHSADNNPLCQNNSRDITEGPSICPRIYRHEKISILWPYGWDVLIYPLSQKFANNPQGFGTLARRLPQIGDEESIGKGPPIIIPYDEHHSIGHQQPKIQH